MPRTSHTADEIGQAVIDAIGASALAKVSFACDQQSGAEIEWPVTVTVWSANAAEQIGQMILDKFFVSEEGAP